MSGANEERSEPWESREPRAFYTYSSPSTTYLNTTSPRDTADLPTGRREKGMTTTRDLRERAGEEPITMLTAYDAQTARLIDD